jgi:hypothetical protein
MTRQSTIATATYLFALIVAWAGAAQAQMAAGNWVRTDKQGIGITLTVESCCNGGMRLTYHIPGMGGQPASTMVVESPLDGTPAPVIVDGKDSGETMTIRRIDATHMSTTMTMNGKPFGTASTTLSADGKSATTESTMQGPNGPGQKVVEIWVRE